MRKTRRAGPSQRYYRTAALLGPQDQQMVVQAPAARRAPAAKRASGARHTTADGRSRTSRQAPAAKRAPAARRSQRGYRAEATVAPRTRSLVIPWRLLVPLLALIIVALWVALGNAWYVMWDDVKVSGIYDPMLRREVKIASDLLGWHSFLVEPETAEAAVMALLPQATAVEVTCRPVPALCEIAITERVPVLVWMDGATAYWVDREGIFYPAQGERPDLPVIRGKRPVEGGAHTLAAIRQGVAALTVLGVTADRLEYLLEQGLVWTDPEGRHVAFGVGADMADRWQTYQVLLNHFAVRGISPQVVDVRFPDGATYSQQRAW